MTRSENAESTLQLASALAHDVDNAFPQFVEVFENTIFSIAYRMCGNRDQALDLSADAFHQAYGALRAYDTARIATLQLRPWIVTIILNRCRNALRSSTRRVIEVPLDEATLLVSATNSPEQTAETNAGVAVLIAQLRTLPDKQRVAVVLHHIAELSYEEIALVMSCPVGTAKSHAARGLSRLRDLMVSNNAEGGTQ